MFKTWQVDCLPLKRLHIPWGSKYHMTPKFCQYKLRNFPWYFSFLSQQVKFSLLLEKNLFPPFLCNLKLITIALPISFTLKHILFAREERLAKRNKATLISLGSRGRAISADIGREFRPLRLVWWALDHMIAIHIFHWSRDTNDHMRAIHTFHWLVRYKISHNYFQAFQNLGDINDHYICCIWDKNLLSNIRHFWLFILFDDRSSRFHLQWTCWSFTYTHSNSSLHKVSK